MRNLGFAFVLALAILALPRAGRAEIMDTTASLGSGHFELGAEFQVQIRRDAPLSVWAHEAVGLFNGFDLQLTQGFGVTGQGHYFGGGIKWTILAGRSQKFRPGIALWLGGHYQTGNAAPGADATVGIDFPLGRVRPYLLLDSNTDFYPDRIEVTFGAIAGIRINIVEHFSWFAEGGVGFYGPYGLPHFVSTGPKLTI